MTITIKQKQIILSIVSITLLSLGLVTPVYAQYGDAMRATVTPGAKAAAREATMTRLRNRADTEITRRVNALTKLINLINAMKRLTTDQKSSFTTGIQGQITALNALKAKIDADTDLSTLRTDVQSIVTSYRIFALYMPQVSIMAHADRLLAIVDEMNTISSKVKARVDAAQSAGVDTTAMQALMTDRAAKIADASTQAQNAIAAVLPLTPDGYPGNKTTLTSARTMLVTARQDLQKALQDVQEIRKLLRAAGVQTNAKLTPVPTTKVE